MRNLVILSILAALGWYGYGKFQDNRNRQGLINGKALSSGSPAKPSNSAEAPNVSGFKCDGRTICSQMTSCTEATFFLKNCPGTKMDGNNDGIPCEKQWCK